MQKKHHFMANIGYGYKKLTVEEINYINIEKRNLCYHMTQGEDILGRCLRQSFIKETENLRQFKQFYLIGTSLLVNINNIEIIGSNFIRFINGTQIYFPKKYHKELLEIMV